MASAYETAAGVTATADRPAPKKQRLSRVEIEVAANGGYIKTCYYEPAEGNGKYDHYVKPSKKVYESQEALFSALKKEL